MRIISGLLVGLLVLAASTLSLACSDDNDPPAATSPTPTATPASRVDPAGLGRPAPTPTPDTTAPPQTVLIELATGRSLALAPPGERAEAIAFSPDGRWLVFYDGTGPAERQTFKIYRVDLDAPALDPELLFEDGFFFGFPDAFSSTGDLAFVALDEERTLWPAVMKPDGSVHRLSHSGHVTSWSPDGRWLTYGEFYPGEDADGNEPPIGQYLVDTETWAERKIGESGPCGCDGNPLPVWAPDSSKFIYTYLVGEISNRSAVNEVHYPEGGAPVQIEASYQWLDSQHYITRVYDEPAATYDVVSVDLAKGARTPLFEDNPSDRTLWMSPTETLFFADGKLFGSDGRQLASVPGGYRRWSPDGRHILTFSNGTSCGRGYRVQASDGELIGCGPYEQEGSPFDFDIQNDAFAYLVPTYGEVDFLVDAYVMDFATSERRVIVKDFVAASTCIELSPDSRFLVIGHACGV